MQLSDHLEFGDLLKALAAAYREEVDEATTAGYLLTLSDLPIERIKAAVVEAMRTKRFFPKAAELREIAQAAIDREASVRNLARHRRRMRDSFVMHELAEAKRIGESRQWVEDRLASIASQTDMRQYIGDLPLAVVAENSWLLADLGECPLALEWPELTTQIAAAAQFAAGAAGEGRDRE